MTAGTRRMWSRRVLRAGWALAPVLRIPAVICGFFFGNRERVKVTLVCGALLGSVSSCTVFGIKMNSTASPAQLTEYIKGDPCMTEMMPRWQKHVKRPLILRDLVRGKSQCDEVWSARREIAAQKKVMEALK